MEAYPSKIRRREDDISTNMRYYWPSFQEQAIFYLPFCLKQEWKEFIEVRPFIIYADWLRHKIECVDCASECYGIRIECTVKKKGKHLKECKQCQELKLLHEQNTRHYYLYGLKKINNK